MGLCVGMETLSESVSETCGVPELAFTSVFLGMVYHNGINKWVMEREILNLTG